MTTAQPKSPKHGSLILALAACLAVTAAPVGAQIRSVDPNDVIDADIDTPPSGETRDGSRDVGDPAQSDPATTPSADATRIPAPATTPDAADTAIAAPVATSATYKRDDLIGAAEGVFGKGAEGLGRMIENILAKQGEPNGYIVGREAGGAFVLGLRYGSGTLYHKVEGNRPAYWTGPSIGFDAGANAAQTFVLVYNLHDSGDLYRRYPAGEGAAYFVGGFNASYLRRGDVVLIPIRLGVGARLGANVGYMKFRPTQDWNPF